MDINSHAVALRSARLIAVCSFILVTTLMASVAADAKHPTATVRLGPADEVIEQAVHQGQIPGAVLLVGHNGQIIRRKAYGDRALEPRHEVMTLDTIFDLASLTKVIATTTAVMQLVEQGKVRLNDPVAKYLPEFAQNGKEDITLRQLLTHYSGLEPDLDLKTPWEGKETAYRMAFAEMPEDAPGSKFSYSDINFIVLGALVERVSGERRSPGPARCFPAARATTDCRSRRTAGPCPVGERGWTTSTRSSARNIHYYRCLGSDAWRHLGNPVCDNRPVRQDLLDHVV